MSKWLDWFLGLLFVGSVSLGVVMSYNEWKKKRIRIKQYDGIGTEFKGIDK